LYDFNNREILLTPNKEEGRKEGINVVVVVI